MTDDRASRQLDDDKSWSGLDLDGSAVYEEWSKKELRAREYILGSLDL